MKFLISIGAYTDLKKFIITTENNYMPSFAFEMAAFLFLVEVIQNKYYYVILWCFLEILYFESIFSIDIYLFSLYNYK